MQKILNKCIINYKFLAEKYIIYGEDRKGKEYLGFNTQIVFDGEYLNGMRNRKGREYSSINSGLFLMENI